MELAHVAMKRTAPWNLLRLKLLQHRYPQPRGPRCSWPTKAPIPPNMTLAAAFLPTTTTRVISEDHQSLQAKALLWLQERPELNTIAMPDWRKLQLMGLVSLYYSTDGYLVWKDWARRDWLDYSTPECSWGGNHFRSDDAWTIHQNQSLPRSRPTWLFAVLDSAEPSHRNSSSSLSRTNLIWDTIS